MLGQQPDAIDLLQARLHPILKWCFMGAGAALGYYYARTDATPIPLSYIVGGAAAGFLLLPALFMSLRLVKVTAIGAVLLIAVNYAVLVPFNLLGGDHMPGWIDDGKAALRWLDPSRLVARWGKDVEIRPSER